MGRAITKIRALGHRLDTWVGPPVAKKESPGRTNGPQGTSVNGMNKGSAVIKVLSSNRLNESTRSGSLSLLMSIVFVQESR